MPVKLIALLRHINLRRGDLVYVRSARGASIPGALLTTASDLLTLKVQAVEEAKALIATGPATDEAFADYVIDADQDEPKIVKGRLPVRVEIEEAARP
ncbi:MAG: hypothetical protein M3406_02775 [Chloroflexota bacterium]|nr:hypothetical protein [Chloroflexota bacterium]